MRKHSARAGAATIGIAAFATAFATTFHVPAHYATIQEGIDAAARGDTVLVEAGIYRGAGNRDLDFGGVDLVLRSELGAGATVIDCEELGRGFMLRGGETREARIEGFTVRKGNGGIACVDASPTIVGCYITSNSTGAWPPNQRGLGDPPPIEGSHSTSITTPAYGGGVYGKRSDASLIDCVIARNQAWDGGGGGVYFFDSVLELRGCDIHANKIVGGGTGWAGGGGVLLFRTEALIRNCIITRNSAEEYGGGILVSDGLARLENCTLSGNTGRGDGLHARWDSEAYLVGCVLWGNGDTEIEGDGVTVTYSNVDGGWPGEGNLNIDPLFRDPVSADYRLQALECGFAADSPCIDAGDPPREDSILDCAHGLGTRLSDMGAYGAGELTLEGSGGMPPIGTGGVRLHQVRPNPINPVAAIPFEISAHGPVHLAIYDARAALVRVLVDESLRPGHHSVTWDGTNSRGVTLPSGPYLVRLVAESSVHERRIVVLK